MLGGLKIKKKYLPLLLFLGSAVAIGGFLLFAGHALAQVDVDLDAPKAIGLGDFNLKQFIARIIQILLGFLGIIAVVIIMYAGWMWMSSQGNEDQISRAKKMLTNAIIGLLIIMSAFGFVTWLIRSVIGGGGGAGSENGPHFSANGVFAARANSIIEMHYPGRGQTVPRNTKIVVTFKEAIDPSDLVTGTSTLNINNIRIYRSVLGTAPSAAAITDLIATGQATMTPDRKTFRFKPEPYLGTPTQDIWYTVALSKNIKKANGRLAFDGVRPDSDFGYDWNFQTNTQIDKTPPKIIDVIPYPQNAPVADADRYARNVVMQVNFDEAIDPTSDSGKLAVSGSAATGTSLVGFNNIQIFYPENANRVYVAGNLYISNQYRTVEFLTEDKCGVNSCGDDVFCLPGGKNISALIKAATVETPGDTGVVMNDQGAYDGLVDMCDNSLDGNSDGIANGTQAQTSLQPYNKNSTDNAGKGDDFTWSFFTGQEIDLTPPTITEVYPRFSSTTSMFVEPYAFFDSLLMSSSLIKDYAGATGSAGLWSEDASSIYFEITKNNLANKNKGNATTTRANIWHADPMWEQAKYVPAFNQRIKDLYQNCFRPASGAEDGVTPTCSPIEAATPACCNGNKQATICDTTYNANQE